MECVVEEGEYRLLLPGDAVISIASDGRHVCWPGAGSRNLAMGLAGELARELALALAGTFCLHASAVSGPKGVVAFLGPSGAGKSTLATLLKGERNGPWSRFSDDVLGVRIEGLRGLALDSSDRVKLPLTEAPFLGEEENELAAIYVLDSKGCTERSEAQSSDLAGGQAAMALVKNTLSARLFLGELLEKHFLFCLELARQVPVRRLSYPWSVEAGTLVSRILESDLRDTSPG